MANYQTPELAPPPVMSSDQIMQHVDSVYQGLPEPVRAALDHAHSLTGGSPSSSVGDATKPAFPALSSPSGPGSGSSLSGSTAAPSLAPPPVSAAPADSVAPLSA